MAGVTAIILALTIIQWLEYRPVFDEFVARDFDLYRDATARWLADGSFYEAYQLAGPYEVTAGDILYPPVALLLFVPFVYLPAVLWWLIPIGITAWCLWRLRPAPLVWPVLAICLWFPNTGIKLLTGNPVMWSVAAIALGTIYYWPAVFAAVKLSLAPFALFGAWKRSWWFAAGMSALACLLFLPMWPDFASALLNSRQPSGLLYSVGEVPMMLGPIAAWLGRQSRVG
jgi:hypothetical protein